MASDAITASVSANIAATTRDMWDKSVTDCVALANPIFANLAARDQVNWDGGEKYTWPVQSSDSSNLGGWYTPSEPLPGGRASMLTKPWVEQKLFEHPVVRDVRETLANYGGPPEKHIDLSEFLVTEGQESVKKQFARAIYDLGATDDGKGLNSVTQALNHNATYAHTTRATTVTNPWFQGASLVGTYVDGSDQDMQRTMSINLVRQCFVTCNSHRPSKPASYMGLLASKNWLALKGQVDSAQTYKNNGVMANYGFDTFQVDNIEFVLDYYLDDVNMPLQSSPQYWMFLLNMEDWHFMVHPARAFSFEGFVWQGQFQGGRDEWLARIMFAGNLICKNPPRSIWLSNVRPS